MLKDKSSDGRVSKAPASGLEDTSKVKESVKKEAPFPGGSENVAGAGGKKNEHPNSVGSPPVKNDDLDLGNS